MAKKKAAPSHKVHTKISDDDYQVLIRVCCEYGFQSVYQILQTLLKLFIKSLSKSYKAGEGDAIAVEITDIFDDLAQVERYPQPKTQKKTINYEKNDEY